MIVLFLGVFCCYLSKIEILRFASSCNIILKMVMCWAPECKHYNSRETCKFFKFPKDLKLRNKWKTLVRRGIEPGPGAFLCSCHFPEGKRENLPTLFVHNKEKFFTFTSPEKKTRKRKGEDNDEISDDIQESYDVNVDKSTAPDNASRTNYDIYKNPQPSSSRQIDPEPACSSASDPQQLTLRRSDPPMPALIESESYFLRQQVEQYQEERFSKAFCWQEICEKDSHVRMYTGLPTASVFISLFAFLENIPINYYLKWKVEKVPKIDQLLLTLMKLRQNFPHEDLAHRFKISQTTVTNIFITWIHILHEILFKQLMEEIPSRKKNQTCLPNCFSTFTNCRIILDCTEMAMMVPRKSMQHQKATYSSYKHKNTWKALIGVAPNGVVTYVSDLYPGATSDKKIVEHSGVLQYLEAGDLILADKGFLLKDILPPGVHLNIPPFLMTPQFTPQQVKQTEKIAQARIHVERAIRRMKQYKILGHIPHTLFSFIHIIVQVVGALTNLHVPLIKEVEDAYSTDET